MFGFGNKSEKKEKVDEVKETAKWTAMTNTFGTTDVDEVLKQYAPELTGAILEARRASLNIEENITKTICQNQVNVNENVNLKYNELMAELKALREQNHRSLNAGIKSFRRSITP